jgi:hypothetical protein
MTGDYLIDKANAHDQACDTFNQSIRIASLNKYIAILES